MVIAVGMPGLYLGSVPVAYWIALNSMEWDLKFSYLLASLAVAYLAPAMIAAEYGPPSIREWIEWYLTLIA